MLTDSVAPKECHPIVCVGTLLHLKYLSVRFLDEKRDLRCASAVADRPAFTVAAVCNLATFSPACLPGWPVSSPCSCSLGSNTEAKHHRRRWSAFTHRAVGRVDHADSWAMPQIARRWLPTAWRVPGFPRRLRGDQRCLLPTGHSSRALERLVPSTSCYHGDSGDQFTYSHSIMREQWLASSLNLYSVPNITLL